MEQVFEVGQEVRKVGGSYQARGEIRAALTTLAGLQRYVFEFYDMPGMLHIFNGSQLEPITDEPSEGQ